MNTKLKKGDITGSGFKILEVLPLEEINSEGIYAKHEKTNCEVFHVLNNDSENLFAFCFATAPEDSSGVAHIIEHTVLCGSKKYPLKDAFTVLCQGSLQTFLNAWTFPDKTVYPASSTNVNDYFNLMSVYGDCVFNPLLDEWTFMQEGHHVEWTGKENKIQISGVVYNEMKGAYSAPDEYAMQWSTRSVLPDTIYALDSGGDPEEIPNLSYSNLKKFHAERYAPANCKIFLAGNIPTEDQLSFINENFLKNLKAGSSSLNIKKQEKWDKQKYYFIDSPGSKTGEVFISWLLDKKDNVNLHLAVLEEILLGHDGSPLSRKLTESPLGEDLSAVCGLDTELNEPVFTVGLRGVNLKELRGVNFKKAKKSGEAIPEIVKQIEDLIFGELERLVTEGISKKEIESALFSLEFSMRQIKRANGPWSLVWLRHSLRGWLFGANPWDSLLLKPSFDALKKTLLEDDHYFEKLIKKELLLNNHRALVVINPQLKFLMQKERALSQRLKTFETSLSKEQKQKIIQKNIELEKKQNEEDSRDILEKIPHITKKEIVCEITKIERSITDLNGIPVVSHNLFTNGITYFDAAFPVDIFDAEDYIWLPVFSICAGSLGLPGIRWNDVSSLVANTFGSFNVVLNPGSSALNRKDKVQTPSGLLELAGRPYLIFSGATLDEKTEDALALFKKLITDSDFTDTVHIGELILEIKNNLENSIAPMGSMYAQMRSSKMFSLSNYLVELWQGLTQVDFIHKILDYDINEISRRLVKIQEKIISTSGCIINITRADSKEIFGLIEKNLSGFKAPCPLSNIPFDLKEDTDNKTEVFSSPSLQVGFSAMACKASDYTTMESCAEKVLCHYLSTGPLWRSIRMKGGAYGVNASVNTIENCLVISTYRDPNPFLSVKVIPEVLCEIQQTEIDKSDLEKTIIGTYSKEKKPYTPAQNGFKDFLRLLSNVYDTDRQTQLQNILNVQTLDIQNAAKRLNANITDSKNSIITPRSLSKIATSEYKVKVQNLPV
ncbi:MAG: insulinase family protein [Spirochaetaceae bacterium]|jgi:Zn-dependent M16 (insulinase) family peptidase|nr:insulinase family protein [Spirochaetaceae bacterium]